MMKKNFVIMKAMGIAISLSIDHKRLLRNAKNAGSFIDELWKNR